MTTMFKQGTKLWSYTVTYWAGMGQLSYHPYPEDVLHSPQQASLMIAGQVIWPRHRMIFFKKKPCLKIRLLLNWPQQKKFFRAATTPTPTDNTSCSLFAFQSQYLGIF